MKKFKSNGAMVRRCRSERSNNSTQKELSFEVGISERHLRKIERSDAMISRELAARLGTAFGRPWYAMVSNSEDPGYLAARLPPVVTIADPDNEEKVTPRFEKTNAKLARNVSEIYEQAKSWYRIVVQVKADLSPELASYAKEFLSILYSVNPYEGGSEPDTLLELDLRSRMSQLFVLLKGNDILIYIDTNFKRLPESYIETDEYKETEMQMILAFGPPNKDGEDSIEVEIDNGQPRRHGGRSLLPPEYH